MSYPGVHKQQSKTDKALRRLWRSDPAVLDTIFRRFGVPELDAAATDESAVCPHYLTPAEDGLLPAPWAPRARSRHPAGCPPQPATFCNPPFGGGRGGTADWSVRLTDEWCAGRLRRLLVTVPTSVDAQWYWRFGCIASGIFDMGRVPYLHPATGQRIDAPPFSTTLFLYEGTPRLAGDCTLNIERWRFRV